MTTLKRIIKAGFINFGRHGLISWSAVLVTTITLSVIVAIFLVQAILFSSLSYIKNKVDITIYFNVNVPEEKIKLLQGLLEKLPEVEKISYTNAKEVLSLFRFRHVNDLQTIRALDEIENNPLGASLNIKAKEVSQYENIANFLKSDNPLILGSVPIINKINYYQNKFIIDRLDNIIFNSKKLGFLVTLILIIISIITTFNTIRLIIYIAKEEIVVMRLIGASKTQVHGPFMIEGAIYGILASIITMLLFLGATFWLGKNMTNFLNFNIYDYYLENFFQFFAIILLIV